MRRTRLALLAALTGVLAVSSVSGAAVTTKPQLTDPAGDAVALGSSYDLVSAKMSTTGVTTRTKKGKRTVTTYTPKNLVAVLTLAGPPSKQTGAAYVLSAKTTGCGGGSFQYSYTPGAALGDGSLFVQGCGTATAGSSTKSEILSDVVPVVAGNTITWTMPLSDVAPDLPVGSTFSGFTASVDLNEPVFGIIGTGITGGPTSIDSAAGDGSFKVA